MGMTIDKTIEFFNGLECHTPQAKDARDTAIDTMRKYQMFQAKYAERLRADMVAMLTDLLIDVEEIESREQWCDYATDNCISRYDVEDLIQKNIDNLKGDL